MSGWVSCQSPPRGIPMRRPVSGSSWVVAGSWGGRSGRPALGVRESIARKTQRVSSTVRVRNPTVSNVVERGTTPSVGHRPVVWRRPTTPVAAAGIRIDPPVSLPSAIRADPSHRLPPAPEEEPPGARCSAGSQGLIGVPVFGLRPMPPKASSTVCVLPTMTAPSRRRERTRKPSCCQRPGSSRFVPARIGRPSTPYRSFTDTVIPASGPGSSPCATAASTASACRRAPSASKTI